MTDSEPLANKYGPTKRQEQDRAAHPAQDAIADRLSRPEFDPSTAPAYQQGVQQGYDPTPTSAYKTHEQTVRSRLGWIVAGVWIVAGAVIANFIASVAIGAAAASSSLGY